MWNDKDFYAAKNLKIMLNKAKLELNGRDEVLTVANSIIWFEELIKRQEDEKSKLENPIHTMPVVEAMVGTPAISPKELPMNNLKVKRKDNIKK